jgi:hypothetical protein
MSKYDSAIGLYKKGDLKGALKGFASVAKDHLKYGHAQKAITRLKNLTSESVPTMKKKSEAEISEARKKRQSKYEAYEKKRKALSKI